MKRSDAAAAKPRRPVSRPARKAPKAAVPLHESWVRLKRQLATWPGFVDLAEGGDHAVLQVVAAQATNWLKALAVDGDAAHSRAWLVRALGAMANGTEPNAAFRWTVPGRRYRPPSSRTIEKRASIGRWVYLLIDRMGYTREAACEVVAAWQQVDVDYCADCYKAFGLRAVRKGRKSE